MSKKQTATAFSTPEAEIVAANLGLRAEGLPIVTLMESILRRKINLQMNEDNTAAIQIFKTGYSPALRHTGRTHRVSLSWLKEIFLMDSIKCRYVLSCEQCADVFTKIFNSPEAWEHAVKLINHVHPYEFWTGRRQ